MKLTRKQIQSFQNTILNHYIQNGRHHLPWRKTRNPYRILVSEIMLQQTQVVRVIPKYTLFIKTFPGVSSLVNASLADVVAVWQGLGYNRRAVLLKKTASAIVNDYSGRIPRSPEILETLPGIGHATANSIAAFAFNKPVIFIETNIRTVYIHFFLAGKQKIHDNMIIPLLEQTLHSDNPREWYFALMDFGMTLKKEKNSLNQKSVHYTKQSPFKGSVREIRGSVIRLLSKSGGMTKRMIELTIPHNIHDIDSILIHLQKDGLIQKIGKTYKIC